MSGGAIDPWLLLDSGPGDCAFNMALDEAMLEFATETRQPVLRFYGWTQPAASFGYFQRIAEIEFATSLRPLVRRTTGGGLVPHDADWTYSVVVPPHHAWYELRAPESYERMHRWIQSACGLLGVATELAAGCREELPGQCFAGYEKSDVLRLGRKMAGAAQRRTKTGLLIQGSIQPPPPGVSRMQWQDAMIQCAASAWNFDFEKRALPPALNERAEILVKDKFSRDDHNRRR